MAPRILFVVPYPLKHAPSQRFRVELYEQYMVAAGFSYTIEPFMDKSTWDILYKGGSTFQKIAGTIRGFLKRASVCLFTVRHYDYVFIHREASPVGPPFFEWIISKLHRKKVIYDFDDAIWIPNTSQENRFAGWLKAFWKVKYICKWSYKVAAGNRYLSRYASQFNDRVILLPTNVDILNGHNRLKEHSDGEVVIGWTGSHSTLHYLDALVPVLSRLSHQYRFRFLVIADKDPQLSLDNYEFIRWNETTEIDDLLRMDIGIMPLHTDAWSEGKCGFKLIQYLALGIPAVASPVGVNKEIIKEGENGFLASTPEDWYRYLSLLISEFEARSVMGANGRKTVVNRYSIQAHRQQFLDLFS